MPVVAFFKEETSIEVQNIWEKRLKIFIPSITLVPLLSNEAKKAEIALLWKAPLKRLNELKNLKGLISLGQGVDHILSNNSIPNNVHVIRIVDPYMAKSMSHWIILSILNYIRDTQGYYDQAKNMIYKPRDEINFLSVKIGIYGIGAIGGVVAQDLNSLGFDVNGWSRTKKNINGIKCFEGKEGFDILIKNSNVHVCLLPLTSSTVNIFNNSVFKSMKKGASFINAGRGEHVVEDDLIENCQSGQISHAVLDVYRNEPLPANDPLWKQDNITLWPHVAAETNLNTAAEQIANAISCLNNNNIPPNAVDRDLGY